MVTTTAPPPFLARISAGFEDPRRLPTSSLLQRLLRADPGGASSQPGCCLVVGPVGSARPAPKRVRRRRGKIRPAPSGLLQSRYQQFQQHRAGCGRRNTAQEPRSPYGVPVASPEPRLEEAPADSQAGMTPAGLGKPLRKELFKNKIGKSEKATIPYNQPVLSAHLCDQSKTNRQRSKCNISLNKISSTEKNESNFWQESVSPDLIKNQKKPLKNTENIKSMKSKKTVFLTEANQKENYAGAKFSDPPSPSVLPKPPSHWVGSNVEYSDQNKEMMAVHLKTLLKVQA
ncbi:proline-rich nuclear receptor coactivator 1 [Tiliqua scincoides]|uniref:proline-rich nuclear receptor coactivator 1 n=1 Tax=Tiliqua scincoides TaxID=71010 RepID=UPI0034619728